MSGYSWVSVTALLCYLFLLLTFLAYKKKEKVIRSFMLLMLIMIMWAGGSFAMRKQLWPSVNFWHHVSVYGMMLVASGYYLFCLSFLEEKNYKAGYVWIIFHTGLFIFNCITGLFVPEPIVETVNGSTQFIYIYTWHIYVLLACILPCLIQLVLIIRRHCKGNRIALQQLSPIIYGLGILLIGHVATTLPFFKGFPLDIISGVVNALFVFYALYKKRLFKMTVLLSKANYAAFAVVMGGVIAMRLGPLHRLMLDKAGMEQTVSTVILALLLVLIMAVIYGGITLIHNFLFVRRTRLRDNVIKEFADEVNHSFMVGDILTYLTEVILQTTHIEKLSVFLRQADGDYRVEHTTNPLDDKGYYLSSDHPLLSYLKKENAAASVRNFSRSTYYRSMWEKEKHLLSFLKAEHFIPLKSDEELIGIVVLPEQKEHKPYRENDLQTAYEISRLCSTALKDASAYERAITEARRDKLTGLINRKYFIELLDKEFEKYKDTALSLCLLNIDDFKLYNQLYGTQEGDIALSRVAGIIRAALNDSCHAARIGGKEFALLLPGYDIYSAKLLTENLVAEIMEINARTGNTTRKLTVSAGICAAPYMASSAKELFQNAETAVYTVKRSGKNAVQIYSTEIFHQEEIQSDHISGYGENASTIYALTAAIDTRDHYTFQHSQNVAYYGSELAKAAGMESDLVDIAKEAGLLHDIGKIGIREDILNKPGKLTDEEFEAMKLHVENAVNIIRYLPSLEYVIPAVRSHHERYDGRGYPQQLEGEEIPILGRILCIADSFDAMTSNRSYRNALSTEDALAILQKEAGKQFDPKLAIMFIDLVTKGKIEVRNNGAES